MAELKPEAKARLDALTPAQVNAEVDKGHESIYQREKMRYLIDLKRKYEQQAKHSEVSIARTNVVAVERVADAAEKGNKLTKAGGRWPIYAVVVAILAIVVMILLSYLGV